MEKADFLKFKDVGRSEVWQEQFIVNRSIWASSGGSAIL